MKVLMKLLPVLLLMFAVTSISGQVKTSVKKEYYTLGNEAYKNKDYIEAFKNLTLYLVFNDSYLAEKEPEFYKKLKSTLDYCEQVLRGKIIIIQENCNGSGGIPTTTYFNGNGKEISPQLSNYIKTKAETGELELDYDKLPEDLKLAISSKGLGQNSFNLISNEGGNLVPNDNEINKLINNLKNNDLDIETTKRAIEYQILKDAVIESKTEQIK